MDQDDLLHHTITREETQPKSRRPFARSGKDLLSTALPNKTKAHWIAKMWSVDWQPSTSRLREYIVSPSKCCPGSDLPRQAWVKLNRLRTEVGRFNADMWRWGLSKSPACDCGADQQTANHIITECHLYRSPNGLHGSINVDADAATRECLLNKFPERSMSFDYLVSHARRRRTLGDLKIIPCFSSDLKHVFVINSVHSHWYKGN